MILILGAGAALVTLFAVLSRIDGLNQNVGMFLSLMAAAFVAYFVAFGWAPRVEVRFLLPSRVPKDRVLPRGQQPDIVLESFQTLP